MLDRFSQKYREAVLIDVTSSHYPRRVKLLAFSLIGVGLVFIMVYVLGIHEHFVSQYKNIRGLLRVAVATRHPNATYVLYFISSIVLTSVFVFLFCAYVLCGLWFFDMNQRNRLIRELRANKDAPQTQPLIQKLEVRLPSVEA